MNHRIDPLLVRQETWLRTNGLPLVVPPTRRLRGIVPRTVPLLVTFALLATALVIADAAVSSGQEAVPLDRLIEHTAVLRVLAGAFFVALSAIPAGAIYSLFQRRLSPRLQLITGSAVIAFWLVGLSAIAAIAGVQQGLHISIADRITILVFCLLISYFGLGSMLRWAGRRAVREIMQVFPAVARILPLLLLTVLLVFFTNELWQLAANLSKPRMWALGLFLIFLILLVILPTAIDMVDDEPDNDEPGLLIGTPFEGLSGTSVSHTKAEWFNLIFVAMAVQFIQTMLFVLVTFAIFAFIGALTLSEKLISTWSGVSSQSLVVLGVELPMEAHAFRVCLILALFSGISFAASTTQDAMYRSLFLERIKHEVQRNLAARKRYRATVQGSRQSTKLSWKEALINSDESTPPTAN